MHPGQTPCGAASTWQFRWAHQAALIGLKPLDVRSLQPNRLLPHAQVVAANGTAVLVSQQYFGPKRWITSALWIPGDADGLNLCQTHSIQNITANAFRKMRIHNALRHDSDEFRISQPLAPCKWAW